MRGKSGAPLVTANPPGYPPHATSAGMRWSVTAPARPRRSQICWQVPGRAGLASTATMRSASMASPSTASTAGPGSALHGSFASRWALVARISDHVASRARLGAIASHAAHAPATAWAAASASGPSAVGAGPMPPHLRSTTVAMRAVRLPRLLARSAL